MEEEPRYILTFDIESTINPYSSGCVSILLPAANQTGHRLAQFWILHFGTETRPESPARKAVDLV
jgi:hypothetical protein